MLHVRFQPTCKMSHPPHIGASDQSLFDTQILSLIRAIVTHMVQRQQETTCLFTLHWTSLVKSCRLQPQNRRAPEYPHFQLACWDSEGFFPGFWRDFFFWLVCLDSHDRTTNMTESATFQQGWKFRSKEELKKKKYDIDICEGKPHLYTCVHWCPGGIQAYRCIWSFRHHWCTVHSGRCSWSDTRPDLWTHGNNLWKRQHFIL